jgi:hypothetical protein
MLARRGYVRCFAWLCGPRSWMLALLVLGFLVSLGRPCFGQGRTLSVIINGNGTVRGEGGLIDCPPTCSTGPFGDGRPITLTATQGEGFRFAEWGGACRGTIDRCTVLMTQDQSVTATFRVIPPGSPLVLTVRVEGDAIRSGGPTSLVTSSPPGIRCPDDCSEVCGPRTRVGWVLCGAGQSLHHHHRYGESGISQLCAPSVPLGSQSESEEIPAGGYPSSDHRGYSGGTPQAVDLYLVLELPDQSWLFGQLDGRLIPEARPIVSNWTVAPFRGELFRYTFTGQEPSGQNRWLAGFTEPDRPRMIIGRIAEAPLEFIR